MKLILGLTEGQLRNLNSDKLKYYLGTEDDALTGEDIKERIVDILNRIDELADSANQLNHLESKGVDNWVEFSYYDDEYAEKEYEDD